MNNRDSNMIESYIGTNKSDVHSNDDIRSIQSTYLLLLKIYLKWMLGQKYLLYRM